MDYHLLRLFNCCPICVSQLHLPTVKLASGVAVAATPWQLTPVHPESQKRRHLHQDLKTLQDWVSTMDEWILFIYHKSVLYCIPVSLTCGHKWNQWMLYTSCTATLTWTHLSWMCFCNTKAWTHVTQVHNRHANTHKLFTSCEHVWDNRQMLPIVSAHLSRQNNIA